MTDNRQVKHNTEDGEGKSLRKATSGRLKKRYTDVSWTFGLRKDEDDIVYYHDGFLLKDITWFKVGQLALISHFVMMSVAGLMGSATVCHTLSLSVCVCDLKVSVNVV